MTYRVHKSLVKRIRKIESQTLQPRWRVAVKDTDGLYRGECGQGLSEEQFSQWVKTQDKDTQVIIVEVSENLSPALVKSENVAFKVENHVDKNLTDTLKEYESIVKKVSESYLPRINIEEYSEQEKTAILDAYKIIREHHPLPIVESMH